MKSPAERDEVLNNFYAFCEKALKMPLSEQPHREIVEFCESMVSRNKLLLVPRGTWKTSLASTAYPFWMVLRAYYLDNNPCYRVIIDSATVRLSQLVIRNIRSYARFSHSFIDYFGDLYDRTGHTSEGFSLKFRVNAAAGIKEPNFLASGVGAEKTGLHAELIDMDDVVTKENVNTPHGREKVYDHYRMMQAIMEESSNEGAATRLLVVGTRYHDGDLYGRIIKQDKTDLAEGKPPMFEKLIRSAIDPDTGELYYPSKLTVEALEEKKRKMKGLFYAQYMNDPNRETAPFKKEWLRWTPPDAFPELFRRRMTVDLSVKEDEISYGDFTCMVVGGWDRYHSMYVADVVMEDNFTVSTFLEAFFTLCRKWEIKEAVIEADHEAGLAHVMRLEMARRAWMMNIHWAKIPRTMGKVTRWNAIQPFAERPAGIRISDEIPERTKIEVMDQWERAPFASHDDFMDAMELQTRYLPAEYEEGTGERILPSEAGQKLLSEQVAEEKAAANPGFNQRTLAEQFPHIRALKLSRNEALDEEPSMPTPDDALWDRLQATLR